MTGKRKVYVCFIENNKKYYVSQLENNEQDGTYEYFYTPDKAQGLMLDEGSNWYNTCQKGMGDTNFLFEDVECHIINTYEDVFLKENQEIFEFQKGKFYTIKETNGEKVVKRTYSLPTNELQKEVSYSTSSYLSWDDEPKYFSAKTYFSKGVECQEVLPNFFTKKVLNGKNEVEQEQTRYTCQDEIVIHHLSPDGDKTFYKSVEFSYTLINGVEQYSASIGFNLPKVISKKDFENKDLSEEFFANMTGNDWVETFDFSLYTSKEEGLVFGNNSSSYVAPDKIVVEYHNKRYEYDFDLHKYNESELKNFLCDECKSKTAHTKNEF